MIRLPSLRGILSTSGVDPERRNAVLLLAGVGIVVGLALALIGYGYYTDRIKPNSETVFKVGSRSYSYSFLERRALSDQIQGLYDSQNGTNSILAIIGRIEREEVIRIMARQQGVTASDDDLFEGIRTDLGASPEASKEEVAAALHAELSRIKLPLSDYQDIVRSRVLEQKIIAKLEEPLPAQADQVDVFLIETSTQADAILAKQRIGRGEKFEDVAKDVSTDTNSKDSGGDEGWVAKGILPKEVEDVAFNQTGLSDVIEAASGFYLIDVRGHEQRPLDEALKAELAQKQFDSIIVSTATDAPVVNLITNLQIQKLDQKLQSNASA